jgi:hypothetical protein
MVDMDYRSTLDIRVSHRCLAGILPAAFEAAAALAPKPHCDD